MSLLTSPSTMAYDWEVHLKRRCHREHSHLIEKLFINELPQEEPWNGIRGQAQDGQQHGGSVSVTVHRDIYWTATNLICCLFLHFVFSRRRQLCYSLDSSNWNRGNIFFFLKCAQNKRCALEQCLLFQNEDCHLIWNADTSDKHAYLSWRVSVAHQQEREGASLRSLITLPADRRAGEREEESKRRGTSSSRTNKFAKHEQKGFRFSEDIGSVPVSGSLRRLKTSQGEVRIANESVSQKKKT